MHSTLSFVHDFIRLLIKLDLYFFQNVRIKYLTYFFHADFQAELKVNGLAIKIIQEGKIENLKISIEVSFCQISKKGLYYC